MIIISLDTLVGGPLQPADEDRFIRAVKQAAGEGRDVAVRGKVPAWAFMVACHALEGRCRTLWYGDEATKTAVLIFGDV